MDSNAQSNYAHHQQADAEATRRAQEYQKQLAHEQQIEAQKRAEERQRQLGALALRHASETSQGR